MPLGEIVGEIILKPILELVTYLLFYTLWFWTGFVFLEIVSFGKLNLATPEKFGDKSKHPKHKRSGKNKRRRLGRGLWIYKGKRSRSELKPEVTATVGMLLWILVIVWLLLQK